jgi:hypothetical protein
LAFLATLLELSGVALWVAAATILRKVSRVQLQGGHFYPESPVTFPQSYRRNMPFSPSRPPNLRIFAKIANLLFTKIEWLLLNA